MRNVYRKKIKILVKIKILKVEDGWKLMTWKIHRVKWYVW